MILVIYYKLTEAKCWASASEKHITLIRHEMLLPSNQQSTAPLENV